MNRRSCRRLGISFVVVSFCFFTSFTFGQDRHLPNLGPAHRPRVRMIGFVNAKIAKAETRPVVTFTLPMDEKQYSFLLVDMKILAGPLRTPGSILSEVKPFSPNFRIRTSQAIASQIKNTAPGEQLTITAEYSSADRILFVQGVEKGEPDREKSEQKPEHESTIQESIKSLFFSASLAEKPL